MSYDSFVRKTQHEEKLYQQGLRDGFHAHPCCHDHPAYRAGYRAGILRA